jgi:hypothetical protein
MNAAGIPARKERPIRNFQKILLLEETTQKSVGPPLLHLANRALQIFSISSGRNDSFPFGNKLLHIHPSSDKTFFANRPKHTSNPSCRTDADGNREQQT